MGNLIGTELPEFKVHAYHNGDFEEITKAAVLGKWGVFFFYPADFTFVCPTELGDLSDHYAAFQSIGCEIYAVSTDSHFVHKQWAETSDTIKKVTFPMLADPAGRLARFFGILVEEEWQALRGTFVVNPQGVIELYEVHDMGIGRNAEELLRSVQAAQFVAEHGDQVCPAKWKPGTATLKPGLDLVGRI